tara:strand:- start:561 stop:773 length:213 start_codon:yes stop_codon:yes gene_type:complete
MVNDSNEKSFDLENRSSLENLGICFKSMGLCYGLKHMIPQEKKEEHIEEYCNENNFQNCKFAKGDFRHLA